MRNTELKRRLGRASCLSALLRVPRPSASSLTCAKRPGNSLRATEFVVAGSPSALLRVLRPSASPFTYAKRSAYPLGATSFVASRGADSPCAMSYFGDAQAGSPSALLRVPRPTASSFTYAKRSGYPLDAALFIAVGETGSPLSVTDFAGAQAGSPSAVTHFAAMGAVCPPQRSEGGARRAGDMSGGGYAAPMASPATHGMPKATSAKNNAPVASSAIYKTPMSSAAKQSIELIPE